MVLCGVLVSTVAVCTRFRFCDLGPATGRGEISVANTLAGPKGSRESAVADVSTVAGP